MKFLCVVADSEVSVIVRNPLYPRRYFETRALIDTGADFSCIPTGMLTDLGLKVSDYDGVPRLKLAYYLSVELFGKSHSLENVVGIEGETFMLGKDLLGDHSLLLLLPAG
jgi:hypothetical protein